MTRTFARLAFVSRLRLFLTTAAACLLAPVTFAQVFVNELHYDNTGTDTGEAIELAGPAGTDLNGWSIVLYNGSTGAAYNTTALAETIAEQQGGLGTVVVSYPTNGIQNGGPDGIALVNTGGTVVQFLSYEGVFTAVGGPADGQTSVDIGVSEASGTAVGDSLQLTGTGSVASDFTWATAQPNTFGAVNTGQTFGGGEPAEPELVINEIDYDQAGTDSAEFVELKNAGAVPVELGNYTLEFINGSSGGAAIYDTIPLPATSLAPGAYFVVCANATTTANCNLDDGPNTNFIQNGAPDAVALLLGTEIVDSVSYEGDTAAPYTETSGTGLSDSSSAPFLGISRFPDGVDTDVNNVDLSPRCITPGDANVALDANCPDPLAGPPVVINEVLADPATGSAGDANNDGVRDGSEDEFIEIVNISGAPLDISGWTLADAVAVRHTFPIGSVLADQCSIVVFGGGSPSGGFGGAVVQTASGGFLGFNNSGDTITLNDGISDVTVVGYGSEGGNDQSLTLDPDVTGSLPLVRHTTAVGSNGARFSPGERIDGSLFAGCELPILGPFEIFEIQGAGSASPYAGQNVLTQGNVVTAVAPDGFFMQTPTSRSDNDVDTSDGIFVFTNDAPTVAVGDLVDLTAEVVEFFDFTELSNPAVTVIGAGYDLPAAVAFDASTPSPDPASTSCAIEFECYEGMLIEISGGAVTGPNQRFSSDIIAEVHVTAAPARTFREPGIEFPGLPGLPVWDGNPEVFELDADKLGLPNTPIPAGSSFDATGALGFEFGGYELWPSELTVYPATLPAAVRSRGAAEMTVGALNLFRLFDDVDDAPVEVRDPDTNALLRTTDDSVVGSAEYDRRLTKFSAYIRMVLDAPDVLAVSEVESLAVLQDLADRIASDDASVVYTPYLEEGNDIGGIDVGFLVLDSVAVDAVEQLGRFEILAFDGSLLNDRPPLLLEGRQVADGSDFPFAVMAIHGRSLGGIDDAIDGPRVRQKRYEQAQSVAAKVQALQDADPDINLVVAGDFNAFEFTDGYVDVTGHMKGDFVPADNLVCDSNPCPDLVGTDLLNQVLMIDAGERYSFIFGGNAQVLDHALTSGGLDELVRDYQYGRGNADAALDLINDSGTPLRSSDHDGLVLFLAKDSDGDGVTDDADACPGTVIPESVPWVSLGNGRWALTDDDRIFDTGKSKLAFDIFDTAGCSCEQIIAAQGLGAGQSKFGCSNSVMQDWVELVGPP